MFWLKGASSKVVEKELRDLQDRVSQLEVKPKKPDGGSKLASFLGIAGFVIALVGVPLFFYQNHLLEKQLELQQETLEAEGPSMSGEVQVIHNILTRYLYLPGKRGIEYELKAGETAWPAESWVRIEVTNGGRATGSIMSAAVQHGQDWINASPLMCGTKTVESSLPQRDCEMPLIVEPGTTEVFTFGIPGSCGQPERVTVLLTTTDGKVLTLPTEVLAPLESDCAVDGGGE